MTRLIFIFFFFLSCTPNETSKQNASILNNPVKDRAMQRARADLKKDSLKFYYFGVASAPPNLAKYLKESCNIILVNNIELPNQEDSYYNQFTDSVLIRKAGKTFSELYREIR